MNTVYTYDDINLEDVVAETKDEKKGVKDAKKALKKAEALTPEFINTLMEEVYNKTSNSAYICGYVEVCRMALVAIQVAA